MNVWHSFIFQNHLECVLYDLVPNVEFRDACSDMLDYTKFLRVRECGRLPRTVDPPSKYADRCRRSSSWERAKRHRPGLWLWAGVSPPRHVCRDGDTRVPSSWNWCSVRQRP